MTTTDEWVAAALTDDAVVVELLFRLKQSLSPSFVSPPMRWGHRQPRSKPAAASSSKKERESMRCSPTTPLSWSCGGDVSPGDGSDESSRPSDRSSGSRSKGDSTNDATATTTINKRSRKKKTFAELIEEESLLLKESIHLKKEIATVRVTHMEQTARRENLKRVKLDLQLESEIKVAPNSHPQAFSDAGSFARHVLVSPTITTMHQDFPALDSCKTEKELETTERCFVLPDLNMMPTEEDSGCGPLYGLS